MRCGRAGRQIDELQELAVLVAVDVGEALDLPGHDRGEAVAGAAPPAAATRPITTGCQVLCHVKPPVGTSHAGVPMLAPNVNRCVEAAEEVHVPRIALGQRELREDRVGVDEHAARNARVLVAPEPRAAREVDEQVGVGAEGLHGLARRAVVGAVEVDEAPAARPGRRAPARRGCSACRSPDLRSACSAPGRRCTRRCPRRRRPRGRAPAGPAGTSASTRSRRRRGSAR